MPSTQIPQQKTQPSNWRDLYPFESHRVKIGQHQYHYLDEYSNHLNVSPLKSTETMLMVHGNPTWSFHFRKLVLRYREQFRCVVPDHLGSGLSDKPQQWSYRMIDHVENLLHLIRTLDLRDITLIAQDWGGAIGVAAALELPERFKRITLINTAAFPPPYFPLRIRACRIPLLGTIAMRGLNLFARAAQVMTLARRSQLSLLERQGYLSPYNNWHNRIGIDRFVRDIPASPRHPTYQVLEKTGNRLHELADKPILLQWGMKDWCFNPSCLQRFIESFPQAEVQKIADAGHWLIEDATDEVLKGIDQFCSFEPRYSDSDMTHNS